MKVDFTQYMMPDGRTRQQSIEMPENVGLKAKAITDAGFRFEMELLADYTTVSLTIADRVAEIDVAHKLVPNGPQVPQAVEDLIMDFKLEEHKLGCPTDG